jgi:signal transduction histidine kinase/uncharacterized protein YoxC
VKTDSNTPLTARPMPSWALSLVLFVVLTGAMAYLRLVVFGDHTVTLSYGWPLLICLWHRDRRLLWSLAAAFTAIIAYKSLILLGGGLSADDAMHVLNLLIVAVVAHAFIILFEKLEERRRALEQSNDELKASHEEIARQNEELQAQAEELAQQNEEIQHQSEEMQQQAEEITAQAEELQETNAQLLRRETWMHALLQALPTSVRPGEFADRLCEPLQTLFGESADAVAIIERVGDELAVLAHRGAVPLGRSRWPVDKSFAAVVMAEDRTAFVEDIDLRPDLTIPSTEGHRPRSVLATPLRLGGRPAGVIMVYSVRPRQWTADEFRIVEWASAQCSLAMESHQLREQLARTNKELDSLVSQRTAELQEIVQDLEHFSYTITHDLRAPLRAMHGFASMLDEDCRDQLSMESRDYILRITTAAARMDRLITDALSFSGAARKEFEMVPTDPGRLLRGMVESYPVFQPPAAHVHIAPDLPLVLGNEAALTQCFSNLLGNAVKFVEPGNTPRVTIRAERRGEMVRLWFEDNGIGIAPALQSRLFGMFQRLNKSYEGTGIGLALVKKVTARMGGTVGVESEAGRGSRFWLELKAG